MLKNVSTLRAGYAAWLLLALTAGSPTPCIAAAAVEDANTVITLHADGEVRKPTVRLSDLFNGVPALIDTEIAQAPAPGKAATYESRVLVKLAQKYRLDWEPQSVADHVTLTAPVSRISTDTLRDALIRSVREAGAKGEIDLAFDGHPPQIDLPADQRPVFTLSGFDYDATARRFRAEIMTDGTNGQTALPVAGKVLIKRHLPVLAHRLESGTLIGPNDIDWIDAADERVGAGAITEANDLIGRELRHTINDSEVLHTADIMPARLVKRGALITMKIESGLMTLTAQGRALQDGTEGETVNVTNTASSRMVQATVTGPDTVTIKLTQQLALNP